MPSIQQGLLNAMTGYWKQHTILGSVGVQSDVIALRFLILERRQEKNGISINVTDHVMLMKR